MIELVIPAGDVQDVRNRFFGEQVETCAVMYATYTKRADLLERLLVRDTQFPAPGDYTRRGRIEAELNPEFVARITKRARREKVALIVIHSHLDSTPPIFSAMDSVGEQRLAAFLAHRHPMPAHLALVISEGGTRSRRLGTEEEVRVLSMGNNRETLFDPLATLASTPEVFDRQVRAFGSAGQHALQRLRIAIVGLGGIGSLIAQQLVHLGVRDFILIDPDVIEITNLNRVANATHADIGQPKVDVAARYIQAVANDAKVARVQGDIIRAATARELLSADFIFGCTDSHGSRAVLQQIAYQYLIPYIDLGTVIATRDGKLDHIYGRIQLLSPGLACFACDGLLDSNEVRRDMMTAFERQADPYIQGAREPAPAVMPLNGTVASLGVTMFLSVVVGVPSGARHILYDMRTATLRVVKAQPNPDCYICSPSGAFARGDDWPIPGRLD